MRVSLFRVLSRRVVKTPQQIVYATGRRRQDAADKIVNKFVGGGGALLISPQLVVTCRYCPPAVRSVGRPAAGRGTRRRINGLPRARKSKSRTQVRAAASKFALQQQLFLCAR